MLLSLALSQEEKQRILDHLPTLSEWQIEALMQVFADERRKFRQWASTEFPVIVALQAQAIQTTLDLLQANAPVTPPLLEAWTRRILRHGTRRGLSLWLDTLDADWWTRQRHACELYCRITPAWPGPVQPLAGTEAGTGAGSSQFIPCPRPRR